MRFFFARSSGLTTALVLAVRACFAQEAQPSEYQVKAAFMYHFAQLVSWPPSAFNEAKTPLVVAVLGENPFGTNLEQTLHGKRINEHPLDVREVQSVSEATNGCHILFISSSEKKRLPDILQAVRGTSLLTVAEMDPFTEAGGMIQLFREGSKIRFRINDSAAKAAGLKISSKLLNLAAPRREATP